MLIENQINQILQCYSLNFMSISLIVMSANIGTMQTASRKSLIKYKDNFIKFHYTKS